MTPNDYANSNLHEMREVRTTTISFLDLPAELRNRIYEYVAGEPDLRRAVPYDPEEPNEPEEANSPVGTAEALFAVNRQTRHEFMPIYHAMHGFRFDAIHGRVCAASVSNWVHVFGADAFRWIRRFTISLTCDYLCHVYDDDPVLHLAFGQPQTRVLQALLRSDPDCRDGTPSPGVYRPGFWVCGVYGMVKFEEAIALFLQEMLEGREETRLTPDDFQSLVCVIGKLFRCPLGKFIHSRRVFDSEVSEFWHMVEGQLARGDD